MQQVLESSSKVSLPSTTREIWHHANRLLVLVDGATTFEPLHRQHRFLFSTARFAAWCHPQAHTVDVHVFHDDSNISSARYSFQHAPTVTFTDHPLDHLGARDATTAAIQWPAAYLHAHFPTHLLIVGGDARYCDLINRCRRMAYDRRLEVGVLAVGSNTIPAALVDVVFPTFVEVGADLVTNDKLPPNQ